MSRCIEEGLVGGEGFAVDASLIPPMPTSSGVSLLFREGIDGFKGGLSAESYVSITGTSRATATRYLQDQVEKGALTKTGELRYTQYHLNLAKP